MISIEDMMGIIATEALEGPFPSSLDSLDDFTEMDYILSTRRLYGCKQSEPELPPIDYTLQLLKKPDGTLCWVE